MDKDMKTYEDIENISLAELEKMAEDTSVEVPKNLEDKVRAAVLAADELEKTRIQRSAWKVMVSAAAVVAAIAIGLNVHSAYRTPADTFATPEEALAHLEKTFALIESKADKSIEVAERVNPKLQKTYGRFYGDKEF